MTIPKINRMSSLMGLSLDERQLTVTVATRSGDGYALARSLQTTLTLDPLTAEPELVGREIRNRLEEAGIRDQMCAVCLPLPWVLTLQVKIPEMPEEDIPGFLMIEAERGLPYAPADLSLAISRYKTAGGEARATLIAVPMGHVQRLEKALRQARLKPISFSLGMAVLATAQEGASDGEIAIGVGSQSVELYVRSSGGVVTLRSLEGAIDGEASHRVIDAEVVGRELRITLGQLSKETRGTIRRARVFGRPEAVQPILDKLSAAFQGLGLTAAAAEDSRLRTLQAGGMLNLSGASAFALAAQILSQGAAPFEFLPPRPSRWKTALQRCGSRKVVTAGIAAAAVILLTASAFSWQHWTLSQLESRDKAMKPRVSALDDIEMNMRQYRRWFDESLPVMRVLREVVQAFPEDGSATAKNLQINGDSEITCAGQVQDNAAFIKLFDRLSASPQITDVKVVSVSGKSPMQFNISCHWNEGGKNEN